MTDKEISRQDFVDNAIFGLIQEINPTDKTIDWDIDFIGEIRDVILNRFLKANICVLKRIFINTPKSSTWR